MEYLVLALALSASSALAYTEQDITYNSKCGEWGVGKQYSPTKERDKDEIHERQGKPGQFVNKNGYWAKGCTMPPKPKDCAERVVAPWRGKDGWGYCEPALHSVLRAHNEGITQQVHTSGTRPGSKGYQTWTCVKNPDGTFGWKLKFSTCK